MFFFVFFFPPTIRTVISYMTRHVLRYDKLSPAHYRVASWEGGRIGRKVFKLVLWVGQGPRSVSSSDVRRLSEGCDLSSSSGLHSQLSGSYLVLACLSAVGRCFGT